MTLRRSVFTALTAVLAAALTTTGALWGASAANAASYRYWSYWLGSDSGWTYSSWGPASLRPADGSVEGWRFGVSQGTTGGDLTPRNAPDFDQVCGQTPASADMKRVAIIIDPGLSEHAPPGESPRSAWAMCVSAPTSATGFDILKSAASVRTQSGMVCGLSGYPAHECAVIIDATPPRQADSPSQPQPAPSRATPPASARPTPGPTPPTQNASSTATTPDSDASRTQPSSSSAANPPAGGESAEESTRRTSGQRASADDRSNDPPAPTTVNAATTIKAVETDAPPEMTIVSAAVTDPNTGPGPLAAIIGVIAIALVSGFALIRRRLQ